MTAQASVQTNTYSNLPLENLRSVDVALSTWQKSIKNYSGIFIRAKLRLTSSLAIIGSSISSCMIKSLRAEA